MDVLSPFFFQQSLQAMTPILLGALACVLCARTGVLNMAIEGQMLVGAFAAVCGSYFLHSALGGVLAAIVASTLFAGILAIGVTRLRGDAIVLSLAINLLAGGLTAFLLRAIFGVNGAFTDPGIIGIGKVRLDFIRSIPVVGQVLWGQSFITYLAWTIVVVVALVMFYTPVGLRLRGVGEDPEAARSLGINSDLYRQCAVLISGVLTGLAGAQLSLGTVTVFAENMTAGRGWIAVVAMMLGRAHPVYTALACALFALADAYGLTLQSQGLPNQVTDVAPYAVTLVALILTYQRNRSRRPQISV